MPKVTITYDSLKATHEEIAEYIFSALESMGGCLHPEDPLFQSMRIQQLTFHRGPTLTTEPRKLKMKGTPNAPQS
jgi:hypothetical protein